MAEEETLPTPAPALEPTAPPEPTSPAVAESFDSAHDEPEPVQNEPPAEAQPVQMETAQSDERTAQTRGMSRLAKRVSRSIPLTTSRWLSPRRHLPMRRSHLGHGQ